MSFHFKNKTSVDRLVIIVLLAMTAFWIIKTYRINCWPDDSCITYIPAASKLFQLRHLSEMHALPKDELSKLNMHGKETLILAIAVFQRLLKDTGSPFPNILVLILAFHISAFLLYVLIKKLCDVPSAFFALFVFVTSFWPYQYILLGAHQPLVLMNFLFTAFFWTMPGSRKFISCLVSGIFFGLMLFSSPTALMYVPYVYIFFEFQRLKGFTLKISGKAIALFAVGAGTVVLLMTWPDPAGYFEGYKTYVLTNQAANHFQHYQKFLSFDVPHMETFRGQGWAWIFKYIILVLPVLFPLYLMGLIYLLMNSFARPRHILFILVSLSTPLFVETVQACQFGRTYFSWHLGIVLTLTYIFYDLRQKVFFKAQAKKTLLLLLTGLLAGHCIYNLRLLGSEILPARLSTAFVRQWLDQHHIQSVFVYQNHPRNIFVADVMNNPKWGNNIKFYSIRSSTEPSQGWILVPPKRGGTIWNNCMDQEFTSDPVLNWLYETGNIEKCSVLSVPPIPSSRIWAQEEEICTYLDLMKGTIRNYKDPKSRIYLLDVQKVRNVLKKP